MKVVSIALFGTGDKYARYLSAAVRAHHNLFPMSDGWGLRVHVDADAGGERTRRLLASYEDAGLLEIDFILGAPLLTRAMLWRLAPVFDDGRDLDAPPMPRDRAVCDAFIASGVAMGTVHDSDQHAGVMGGLCHFRAAEFRRLTGLRRLDDLLAFGNLTDREWGRHGADQDVLNRLLAAAPGLTLLEHRYGGWHCGPGKKPAREPGQYPCEAWSARLPDVGAAAPAGADFLGAHLGAAGYDHEAAVRFWDVRGDQKIAAAIASCERETT